MDDWVGFLAHRSPSFTRQGAGHRREGETEPSSFSAYRITDYTLGGNGMPSRLCEAGCPRSAARDTVRL